MKICLCERLSTRPSCLCAPIAISELCLRVSKERCLNWGCAGLGLKCSVRCIKSAHFAWEGPYRQLQESWRGLILHTTTSRSPWVSDGQSSDFTAIFTFDRPKLLQMWSTTTSYKSRISKQDGSLNVNSFSSSTWCFFRFWALCICFHHWTDQAWVCFQCYRWFYNRVYSAFLTPNEFLGNAVLDNFEEDVGITPDQFNTCITIFYASLNLFFICQRWWSIL